MKAAIHVDLDGAADIYRVHGWRYEGDRDPLFETGLRHALELFEELRIRATLFVIAQDLEDGRKRALLEEAAGRGHEIASHTVTHRRLTQLSRDEKRREIFESRERLSAALGVEVRGFRAPAFCIDRASIELIAEAGYQYDSSTFPTKEFARRVGVSELPPFPRRLVDGHHLMEVCLPAYRPLPVPFHPCFSLVLGRPYFQLGLHMFKRRRSPMILLFHLTDFAEPLPAGCLPGWKSRLYTLSHRSGAWKRLQCRKMIDLVKEDFELVPTAALLREAHSN
jgi:hypothetical protein